MRVTTGHIAPFLMAASILVVAPPVHGRSGQEPAAKPREGAQAPFPKTPGQPGGTRAGVEERGAPRGFGVVLVLGDLQGGAAQDNVPAAARKALADLKNFLP